MEELTDKQINTIKIEKIIDNAQYIKGEIEQDLLPNKILLDDMMELITDIKRSVKNGRY